jgi:hypothetical protein
MAQAVDRDNLPPNTWVVIGRPLSATLNSDGSAWVRLRGEDGRDEGYSVPAAARYSEDARVVMPVEAVALLSEAVPKGEQGPVVWLGCDAAGVWGVAVRPYDLHGAIKAWMN